MNDFALKQLDLHPEDRVLEIGFGGGYLLEVIAKTGNPSFIAGVDPSLGILQMGNKKLSNPILDLLHLEYGG